jgi:integrase
VRRYTTPRPRNVTVTDEERSRLLAAAPPHLRLWLLLCSDLAIRSGTAIALGPAHFDPARRTLTFTTKCDEHLTLPTTAAVEALISQCSLDTSTSFVRQLWQKNNHRNRFSGRLTTMCAPALRIVFRKLCKSLNFTRRIVLHDLRRTTAVAIYRRTGDVRDAQALLGHKNLQSTFWYLDHDIRPLTRETLESIKRPFLVQQKEKSA